MTYFEAMNIIFNTLYIMLIVVIIIQCIRGILEIRHTEKQKHTAKEEK